MKTNCLLLNPGIHALICFAALAASVPQLPAVEGGRETGPNQGAARSTFEIDITNGSLRLDSLRNRINLRNIPAASTDPMPATLGNLVEVLRLLHPDSNIVLAPGVDKLRITDLKLRAADLADELEALRVASGYRFSWSVGAQPSEMNPYGLPAVPSESRASDTPLFVLSLAAAPEGERKLEVFNLQQNLQSLDSADRAGFVDRVIMLAEQTLAAMRPQESAEPPSFKYHPGAHLLIVIADPLAMDITRKIVNALQTPQNTMMPETMPQFGSPYHAPRFETAAASPQRRVLQNKLESIRIEKVEADGLPLPEVIRGLQEEVKRVDRDKRGVNFLINPSQPPPSAPLPGGPIDPATGLPVTPVASEPVDINGIQIRIQPALTDVRLVDVLDAIVRVADQPVRYTVTDYAVVFSLAGSDPRSGGGFGFY